MDELTTDDVRNWDPSIIKQIFQAAEKISSTNQQLGDALANARQRTSDWHGSAGDAFRDELGKHRTDIEADGHESRRVATAVERAEDEVTYCRNELLNIEDYARGNGWTVTPNWLVDDSGDTNRTHDPQLVQNSLTKLKARAETADHDLALAVRAAVGDAKLDEQGHEIPKPDRHPPRDVGSQERPGVTDVNDPGIKWRPGFDPDAWKNSWHNPMLVDNPPGYTGGPGAARDQAWQQYLAHYPAKEDPATGQIPRGYLPNPDAVSDPNLKVLGNAGQQLGTSYAWGGNASTRGPSKGHDDGGGGATDYDDANRVGFDCGGLVRYSVAQGTGNDPFVNNGTTGAGTDLLDTSKYLTPIPAPRGAPVQQYARPGDVVVFGDTGHDPFTGEWSTHHTGIYVGNGVIINAPQSGLPVQTDLLSGWKGQPTDVLRPTP